MKTTTQKLAMSDLDYEMMIFSFYARWCESVTINSKQFQLVLANSAINRWFLTELIKCEAEFHQLTDRYIENVSTQDLKRCYNDCTYFMFNIRPTALLEEIKKTKNTKSISVHGVRIPSLTFNQN